MHLHLIMKIELLTIEQILNHKTMKSHHKTYFTLETQMGKPAYNGILLGSENYYKGWALHSQQIFVCILTHCNIRGLLWLMNNLLLFVDRPNISLTLRSSSPLLLLLPFFISFNSPLPGCLPFHQARPSFLIELPWKTNLQGDLFHLFEAFGLWYSSWFLTSNFAKN